MSYATYLETKAAMVPSVGVSVEAPDLHPCAFPFQRDLTRWALRKGRAAIFASTGLGKTLMQLDWANHIPGRTLILAPLGVALQTAREAQRWGIEAVYARSQADAGRITITNYEMLQHFDVSVLEAAVLDESSILKSFEGKTRTALIKTFAGTPYRLCCTATPAPNDIAEIANHAEFLGLMTRAEMLATFFVHDDEGWRLKGHAREPFYQWLASWGMTLNKPSDLGYSDEGYDLPALSVEPLFVECNLPVEDRLFRVGLTGGITERTAIRKATLAQRVRAAADLILGEPDQQWIAWCGLNDEGRELMKLLGPDAVLVEGADTPVVKEQRLLGFVKGEHRVLVTKASIAGFGLNLQQCARMVFVGLSDSWEAYYQAIRRCWRFGQLQPVKVAVVLSDAEEPIYLNVMRKEREAMAMQTEVVRHVVEYEREELAVARVAPEFKEDVKAGSDWEMYLGDCVQTMAGLSADSIDLAVSSPPFLSLYTYSASERDVGNCRTDADFVEHVGYVAGGLLRVMKPGRLACIHVEQVPTLLSKDGVIGLKDFRGLMIRAFQDAGWIYHGEITIDKDPQAQAIRTHSKALLFAQLRKDASWLRPALADIVLVFRKPGENVRPIRPEIDNEQWIEWARPIWYGIRESDTLQVAPARSVDDERHICPLQLGTIERCIALWSNPGEHVLDPFGGIGSVPYQAILQGRYGIGIELKVEYWQVAVKNLREASTIAHAPQLFDAL